MISSPRIPHFFASYQAHVPLVGPCGVLDEVIEMRTTAIQARGEKLTFVKGLLLRETTNHVSISSQMSRRHIFVICSLRWNLHKYPPSLLSRYYTCVFRMHSSGKGNLSKHVAISRTLKGLFHSLQKAQFTCNLSIVFNIL